jgi:hypothetical protein
MRSKIVKCRKPHLCGNCDKNIDPGEYAIRIESKGPIHEVIDDNDLGRFTISKQIGIFYDRFYLHTKCSNGEY